MNRSPLLPSAAIGYKMLAFAAVSFSLTSCVVRERVVVAPRPHYPPPQTVIVEEPFIEVLPAEARVVWIHGQKYWCHRGHYYRPHPQGHGFIKVEIKL